MSLDNFQSVQDHNLGFGLYTEGQMLDLDSSNRLFTPFNQINQKNNLPLQTQQQEQVRVNNTIFKTGISFYHKILKKFHIKQLNLKMHQVLKINKRNIKIGTLFKLMTLAGFYDKRKQSLILFKKERQQLLQLKRAKLTTRRYLGLVNILNKIQKALQEDDVDDNDGWKKKIVDYWGVTRQKSKLNACIKQVQAFKKQLKA